jgi:hypothetical protein
VAEGCHLRYMGQSQPYRSLHRWKLNLGPLKTTEVRRPRGPPSEHAHVKIFIADQALENQMPRDAR